MTRHDTIRSSYVERRGAFYLLSCGHHVKASSRRGATTDCKQCHNHYSALFLKNVGREEQLLQMLLCAKHGDRITKDRKPVGDVAHRMAAVLNNLLKTWTAEPDRRIAGLLFVLGVPRAVASRRVYRIMAQEWLRLEPVLRVFWSGEWVDRYADYWRGQRDGDGIMWHRMRTPSACLPVLAQQCLPVLNQYPTAAEIENVSGRRYPLELAGYGASVLVNLERCSGDRRAMSSISWLVQKIEARELPAGVQSSLLAQMNPPGRALLVELAKTGVDVHLSSLRQKKLAAHLTVLALRDWLAGREILADVGIVSDDDIQGVSPGSTERNSMARMRFCAGQNLTAWTARKPS